MPVIFLWAVFTIIFRKYRVIVQVQEIIKWNNMFDYFLFYLTLCWIMNRKSKNNIYLQQIILWFMEKETRRNELCYYTYKGDCSCPIVKLKQIRRRCSIQVNNSLWDGERGGKKKRMSVYVLKTIFGSCGKCNLSVISNPNYGHGVDDLITRRNGRSMMNCKVIRVIRVWLFT